MHGRLLRGKPIVKTAKVRVTLWVGGVIDGSRQRWVNQIELWKSI